VILLACVRRVVAAVFFDEILETCTSHLFIETFLGVVAVYRNCEFIGDLL